MKYKHSLYLFIAFLAVSLNCYSQEYDSIFNKAKYYYESEEYKIAIPYFSKCVEKKPQEVQAYKYRGNCYLELGMNDKAIEDYLLALRIKMSSDIFYNLGNAYEKAGQVDSAIYYFRRFIEMEPKMADGYIRLSIQFMYSFPEMGDSAIFYAGKAVKIEPGNCVNLNYLAMAYYSNNQFKSALETALIGLGLDSSSSVLNKTAGISSFLLKDYPSAIHYFERAYVNNSSDFSLLDYKIQAMLLQNTPPEKIHYNTVSGVSFSEISSANLKKAENLISGGNENYSYKNLARKIKTSPLSMSLDEYSMLYIGFTMQPDYPLSFNLQPSSPKEYGLFEEAAEIEKTLLKNPTDFPLYLELADVYLELGNQEKYFENRFRYYGFAESIKASGDGKSSETAYFVNNKSHENRIMAALGYRIISQSQVKQKNHYYDLLTGIDQNNANVSVYFLIDKCYQSATKKGK